MSPGRSCESEGPSSRRWTRPWTVVSGSRVKPSPSRRRLDGTRVRTFLTSARTMPWINGCPRRYCSVSPEWVLWMLIHSSAHQSVNHLLNRPCMFCIRVKSFVYNIVCLISSQTITFQQWLIILFLYLMRSVCLPRFMHIFYFDKNKKKGACFHYYDRNVYICFWQFVAWFTLKSLDYLFSDTCVMMIKKLIRGAPVPTLTIDCFFFFYDYLGPVK